MTIWLHGASVGEVQLARVLINELVKILPDADFILSTMTEQGMEVAMKQLGDKVRCIYAPLDLVGIVRRAIKKIRPSLYICLETELWPAVLFEAQRAGVKLVLLNGRLSERSYHRYRLIKGFMKRILACFSLLSVIQPSDAKRYMSLGADAEKIRVLGNAKYDQDMRSLAAESEERYRVWLNMQPGHALLVAGSTHNGEVEGMLQQKQVPFELLSRVKVSDRRTDTVLVDTVGDLAGLYSVASYVFCGGSLVERGGHNIMEPALFGKPVFYGPSIKDFSDAAELLESAGGGFPVDGPEALTAELELGLT